MDDVVTADLIVEFELHEVGIVIFEKVPVQFGVEYLKLKKLLDVEL
jgi:hypothetical protein